MLRYIVRPVREEYNELEDAEIAIRILDDIDFEFIQMNDYDLAE